MKNIRKNLVFSAIGYVLPMLVALLTIPLMVKYLGEDLYGLYVICLSLIGFMALVDLGIGQTVVKFVSAYEASGEQVKVQPVLGVSLLVYGVLGILTALGLLLAAPLLASGLYAEPAQQVLATAVLQVTAIPLLLSYVNQFFLNVCKAYHRFDLPSLIHSSGNVGGIVLATVLLASGYSLLVVMWGYVGIQMLALAWGYAAAKQVLPAGIQIRPQFQRQAFHDIFSFSSYTFVGNFIGALTSRLDKVLIGIVLGTEAVTYYQIPFTIAQMANGVVHTLVNIAFPRFSELFTTDDHAGVQRLYRLAYALVLLLSMIIAVMLLAVGGEFLAVWMSPEFAQRATLVLQVMAIYFFLQSSSVVGYWVLQGAGEARLTAIMSTLDAVMYGIALWVLSSYYGYVGAAVALFFLLGALPLQYVWVARCVGYGIWAHVWRLLLAAIIGLGMVMLLAAIGKWLGGGWLALIVSGGLMLGVGLIAAQQILRPQQG